MTRLSELTTLRLGGPAGAVAEARTEAELVEAAQGDDVLLVAGGSNLVIADDGLAGHGRARAHARRRGAERDGRVELTVAAGEEWEPFVARCVAEGLAGVESLSGIPGSIGATPIQNVGAYGQEVAETITSVRALDRTTGEVAELRARRLRLRLSLERVQAPPRALGRARGHVRARAPRAVGAARLRRARAHARGAARRGRAARRRARGGARPAPRQGHGARPGRPRLGLRRLVLHQPDPRPRTSSRRSSSARPSARRASPRTTGASRPRPPG